MCYNQVLNCVVPTVVNMRYRKLRSKLRRKNANGNSLGLIHRKMGPGRMSRFERQRESKEKVISRGLTETVTVVTANSL